MARNAVLTRVGFSLVTTVVALLALEGLCRFLPDRISGRREVVQSPDAGSEAMIASEEVPGWDINYPSGNLGPMQYTANHWRMRGPDYPDEKAANVKRVIFVGDSSIFGYLLEWDETMSAHLETLREKRFPDTDYQIANCAVPGHTTLQSIYKLQRQCLAFQPDVVIIGNINSDGTRYTATDRERFYVPAFGSAAATLQKFALYRTLRNLWLTRKVAQAGKVQAESIPQLNSPDAPKGDKYRVPPDEYRENLHILAKLAKDAGAKPVFLLLPSLADVQGDPSFKANDPFRTAMREVAAEEGAPLADGAKQFMQMPYLENLFIDPVHPGTLGAKLLANLIDQAMGPEQP